MSDDSRYIDLNGYSNVTNDSLTSKILREDHFERIYRIASERFDQLGRRQTAEDEFRNHRGHDAIMINGMRGSGKTTLLVNLQNSLKVYARNDDRSPRIHVFDLIDPTLMQHSSENVQTSEILLIILARIYTTVHDRIDSDCSLNGDSPHIKIFKAIENINEIIIKGFDGTTYDERLFGISHALSLDLEIHKLLRLVCECLNVDIFLLPIDDIDMEIPLTYSIIDAINRYFSSPRIIPIVAFSIDQAYDIIQCNFNKYFKGCISLRGFAKTDRNYLQNLPRAFLMKIFPPNNQIDLKDMYDLLTKESRNSELFFLYTRLMDKHQFSFEANRLVAIFLREIYESNQKRIFDDRRRYLTNLSFRAFKNQMRAFLENADIQSDRINFQVTDPKGFSEKIALYRTSYQDKHEALYHVWERYLDRINSSLDTTLHKTFETEPLAQHAINDIEHTEYIYKILWMQQYYLNASNMLFDANQFRQGSVVTINKNVNMAFEKTINIIGLFEIILRYYLPKNQIFWLKRKKKIEKISNTDIIKIKELSTDRLINVALEVTRLKKYMSGKKSHKKETLFAGSSHVVLDTLVLDTIGKIVMFNGVRYEKAKYCADLSFLKSLAFLIEAATISQENNLPDYLLRFLLHNYLPLGAPESYNEKLAHAESNNDVDLLKSLKNESDFTKNIDQSIRHLSPFSLHMQADRFNLTLKDSSFGHENIKHLDKKLVQNFQKIMEVLSERDKENIKSLHQAYEVYSSFISVFLHHLLLEFIASIDVYLPLSKEFIIQGARYDLTRKESDNFADKIDMNLMGNQLFRNMMLIASALDDPDRETKYKLDSDNAENVCRIMILIVKVIQNNPVWKEVYEEAYGLRGLYYGFDSVEKKIRLVLSKNKEEAEALFEISSELNKLQLEMEKADLSKSEFLGFRFFDRILSNYAMVKVTSFIITCPFETEGRDDQYRHCSCRETSIDYDYITNRGALGDKVLQPYLDSLKACQDGTPEQKMQKFESAVSL